ncbi:PASTA domain-containing protein [Microbispora hainanensis]|uniref:PASTA domain-containing protein n=1 Tax=Microbispora hainanensis TaxID=568844 RepID=UPI003253BCB8
MASKKTANLAGPIIVVLLVVAGCQKLVSSVFGDDEQPVSSAATATPGPLPDLAKKTLVEAENATDALGLELLTNSLDNSSYCRDKTDCFIYRMSPKAGTVVQPGGKVAVKFVTGTEWAFYRKHRTMPKVVGWSEDKADSFFEPVRWTVDDTLRESSSVPEGVHKVIAQSPRPGTRLRIGQTIKLVIGYNLGSTSSAGGGGGGSWNVDVNVNHGGGESRFCSKRWWC